MAELKVWAPRARKLELDVLGRREPMYETANGCWTCNCDDLAHDTDYWLWIDDEGRWPDPRSNFQPHGISGPSRWVDHSRFEWHDAGWQACPLERAVFYELHIGTFTEAGTFTAAIAHLDELVTLGITHLQVMPIAEFGGNRGWGYDGVHLYAPHHAYGGPDGFKQFVDACHAVGLAVILDVVYNHLGPGGKYVERFGPYFTDIYRTPWGPAVNLDGPWCDEVRNYLVDNALMWLRHYHVDGFRVDAVHALLDRSAIHILEQLTISVKALGGELGRSFALIAECDLNDPRYVRPIMQGGYGMDAQLSEDFHHALHTLLTGERFGYYQDFGKVSDLAQAMAAGYCYADRYSLYRRRRHGRPATGLEGTRFLASMQNHDQIGNRGEGERINHLIDSRRQKLGAAVTLLSPFVPLIFQGEEWAASTPFQYFIGFDDPGLCEAVRRGRRAEFGNFGWNPDKVPDPHDEQTWRRSQLNRSERSVALHRDMLQWYKDLLALRHREPELQAGPLDPEGVKYHQDICCLSFRRGSFLVLCNFSGEEHELPCEDCDDSGFVMVSDTGAVFEKNGFVTLPPWGMAVVRKRKQAANAREAA